MNLSIALSLISVFAGVPPIQSTGSIPASSKIYVDPATGFDGYLAEAIKSYKVPVTITAMKSEADFELQALTGARKVAGPDFWKLWMRGYGEPEIRLVSIRSSEIVFNIAFQRNLELHDMDTAAEACAKGFKAAVDRAESTVKTPKHPILDF
jgi:hypothetical protein